MIHRTFSSLPTFKAMEFRPGLNIILADKSVGASDRQTRNGAGKSSFVELIDFVFGSSCGPGTLFRSPELLGFSFGVEFDLRGEQIAVARTVTENEAKNKKLQNRLVVEGATASWPAAPKLDRETGEMTISNDKWHDVLGRLMFNLPDPGPDPQPFGPTFRAIFPYFARRQSAQAFVSPTQNTVKQQPWNQQLAISYLLGLDWTILRDWQVVRERESSLAALKKAAGKGAFGEVIGRAADIRTKLLLVEERCRSMRQQVTQFQVLDQYYELEREASQLTRSLNELADGNALDEELLADLRESLRTEEAPSISDLKEMYLQVGIVLPDAAVRQFDDVRQFHESVISNRRLYLRQELNDAEHRIAQRKIEQAEKDARRAAIMRLLETHGALEQFSALQGELTQLEGERESLRQRLRTAQQLEKGRADLDVEKARLLTRLQQDHAEQEDRLALAILAFEDASNALYENPGHLTISAEENGAVFDVRIHARKSKGIGNMQIFCFDMMLMRVCAEQGIGPGFLIHDSHIFDGVDERQIGKALEVGAATAERIGWQYIVTMNSDTLPAAYHGHPAIVQPRLTDATEDGGLFGIRFA